MKTILVSFLLTLGFSAQANDYIEELKATPLEELAENYDVFFEGDQLWFGGHIVSILDVCMEDEETFRTVDKHKIYKALDEELIVVGEDYLTKSIYGQKAISKNDEVILVPFTYPTTWTINVVERPEQDRGDYLFSKEYTISPCN